MAKLRVNEYQTDRSKGCGLELEANSFTEICRVARNVIRGLPTIAKAFGVQEAVCEEEVNREPCGASKYILMLLLVQSVVLVAGCANGSSGVGNSPGPQIGPGGPENIISTIEAIQ